MRSPPDLGSFTKLHGAKLLRSSVWLEPLHVRVMWIALLAAADHRGIVLGSRKGLAHMANMPPDLAEQALAVLAAPDPDSSSPEHGGRRIEMLEGGVQILNHGKYRDVRTEAQVRHTEATQRWQAKRKAEAAAVSDGQLVSTLIGLTAEAEADRDAEADREPPTVVEGFALRPPVVKPAKPPSTRAAKPPAGKALGQCGDLEWAVVLRAYDRAREIGGMPAQWGAYRDTPTNRRDALRIFSEGYTETDLLAVLEHIGRGLAAGTHDPKWTTLEHVARSMGRYTQEAAAAAPRSKPTPKPTAPLEIDGIALNDEELAVYRSNAVPAHGAWAVQVMRQRHEQPMEPDPEILRSLGLGGAR